MLCYRCGSYTPDDSRKCTGCGQPFAVQRRATRPLPGVTPVSRVVPPFDNGAVVAGRYRVIAPIDPGTCGWVLRARDQSVDVDVALKVMSGNLLQTSDDRSTFLKAVKACRKVRHPNVVRIYEAGQDHGVVYYTMPYLEGLTLQKIIELRLAKQQVFTLQETLPLVDQLASGLDALATQGGAHGAMRPRNVLVMPDLITFTGLPHHGGLPRRPFLALQAQYRARPYLAPEAQRDGVVTRAADVYSLGVIIGEMLTGKRLGGASQAAWEAVQGGVPGAVLAVLRRAVTEAVDNRFPTATALFEALERTHDHARQEMAPEDTSMSVTSAVRPTPPPPPPQAMEEDNTPLDAAVDLAAVGDDVWDTEVWCRPVAEGELARSADSRAEDLPLAEAELVELDDAFIDAALAETELLEDLVAADGGEPVAAVPHEPTADAARALALDDASATERANSATRRYGFQPEVDPDAQVHRSAAAVLLGIAAVLMVVVLGSAVWWRLQRPGRGEPVVIEAVPIPDLVSNQPNRPAMASLGVPPGGALAGEAPAWSPSLGAETRSHGATPVTPVAAEPIPEPGRGPGDPSRPGEAADAGKSAAAELSPTKLLSGRGRGMAGATPQQAEPFPSLRTPSPTPSGSEGTGAPPPHRAPEGCPQGMVAVRGGDVRIGSHETDTMRGFGDLPQTAVSLPAYCIDAFEYPNQRGRLPLQETTWLRAKKLCERDHKRLCTEAEWEHACAGPGQQRFPFGESHEATPCNLGREGASAAPAGAHGDCRSGAGVYDMAGNVAEWTASRWSDDIGDRVVKGGGADQAYYTGRCAARAAEAATAKMQKLGFRCCADLK